MRNKWIIILIFNSIFSFCLGSISKLPKIITKEITKEIRVYDFTQEQKAMELYANMMGKTLESKKDVDEYKRNTLLNIEEYRHKIWQEGYIEGIKNGK